MLRRIASRTLREPVARPSSPGPQPVAATSAAVLSYQYQLLQQSRGLVSSVLLSSTRDAYETKKIAELKADLKSRGLASTGRKDDLIKRLVDHDSFVNGSTANISSIPSLRKKSTLASLRDGASKDASKDAKKADAPAPPAPTSQSGHAVVKGTPPSKDGGEPKGPIVDADTAKAVAEASKPLGSMKESETPANLEPGTVHNAAADGLAGDATAKASPSQPDEGPAKKTTPPGLPPHKAPQPKETFNVQIPYYPDAPVPGPEIPVVTSYTSPHLRQPASSTDNSPFMPKAISVSASSAISHASDMSEHSNSDDSSRQKGILAEILADLQASTGSDGDKQSALKGINKSVDAAKDAWSSVAEQAKGAFASAAGGESSSSSGSSGSSGSGSSSRRTNRPLNEQERSGAFVLAGIVVGGFVLGGLGKPSKAKDAKDAHHDSNSTQSHSTTEAKSVTVVPVAAIPKGDRARAEEDAKPTGSAVPVPAGSKVLAPVMCVPKGTQLSAGVDASAALARLAQLSTCEVSITRS